MFPTGDVAARELLCLQPWPLSILIVRQGCSPSRGRQVASFGGAAAVGHAGGDPLDLVP